MALKAVHESLDEIPDEYRTLYTEKSGKYELTGIQGVKTQADVDRLSEAIKVERAKTASVKERLAAWGDLDHEEVKRQLDRVPELEAAAKGKLDEDEIERIVERRVDGTIRSRLSPIERQLKTIEKERDELKSANDAWTQRDRTRKVHDSVLKSAVDAGVEPDVHDDVLLWADRLFEVREDDGQVVTKDGMDVTPGITPADWLSEIQPKKKRIWWGDSVGGGSTGSNGRRVPGFSGKNPFSAEHWNMTEQSRVYREMGRERCEQLAKAAGTTLGGQRPAAKK
ncbi:MAG TPA: hypothetical protein VFG22_15125 [Polyangiales bacterium]|nr:hypothetical protein [Polyangiales bacterium]